MIRFLLHDTWHAPEITAPSLSILDYLRLILGRTGTKEGCAAGDCGACTVVVASLVHTDDDASPALAYQAVNACITPLGSLHGKQLITVEDLAENKTLHPVQQAMVDCHGSQCGFCTPGIVMSLFACYQTARQRGTGPSRHDIEIALSGNLCRCTGYRPIIEAAFRALEAGAADKFEKNRASVITELKTVRRTDADARSEAADGFLTPESVDELAYLLATYPDAELVAGATDKGLDFTQSLQQPPVLIYTGDVADLHACHESAEQVVIGGAATYTEALPFLEHSFPAFAALIERLGSLQIRNRGTLAGNIANASPIGDTLPVLLALDATVTLRSHAGTRTVPVDAFFTGYRKTVMAADEFIEDIVIPKPGAGDVTRAWKISKRFDDDISALCMGLWLRFDGELIADIRIGLGGVAATPLRAARLEDFLRGKPLTEEVVAQAWPVIAEELSPIDDVRASASYRLAMVHGLLTRLRLELEGKVGLSLFPTGSYQTSGAGSHV